MSKFLNIFFIIIFSPLSLLYFFCINLRKLLYNLKILKKNKITGTKVICVGNITAGGTGKTSTVIHLAEQLKKRNYNVVILTRGYKRIKNENHVILTDKNLPDISFTGDEPLLLSKKLVNVPVIVGPQRYKTGKLALKLFSPDIILMDDGFQHISLSRDMDIVLINAINPFGNGFLLPSGRLREPLYELKRADIVCITNVNLVEKNKVEDIKRKLLKIKKSFKIFEISYKIEKIKNYSTGTELPVSDINNRKVATLCGIGNPLSFELTVEKAGIKIYKKYRFPDHHWFKKEEIQKILLSEELLLTTEKDAIRMDKFKEDKSISDDLFKKINVLSVRVETENNFIEEILIALRKEK